MSRIPLLVLSLLGFVGTADAAAPVYVSDAIEEESEVVTRFVSIDTVCETFSVDEQADLLSVYRTAVSVEEVLVWPEWAGGQPLVVGESIDVLWESLSPGIDRDEELESCATVDVPMSSGDVRTVVLTPEGDAWSVDNLYMTDVGEHVGGDGVLPDCGEDLQAEVLAELQDDPAEDPEQDEDRDAADGEGADGPARTQSSEVGCNALALPAVGPAAALLALVGLARRRRS